MNNNILSFIHSDAVNNFIWMFLGAVLDEPVKKTCRQIYRRGRRVLFNIASSFNNSERKEICFFNATPRQGWVVLDNTNGKGYTRENLVTHYVEEAPNIPDVVADLRDLIYKDEFEKIMERPLKIWNGKRYYLRSFNITREYDEEQPKLIFSFGPSEYLNFLATSLSLDREIEFEGKNTTLRKLYLENYDPWGAPIPFLAHSFGINLAVITSDNYLLLAQRSSHVKSRPLIWNVAVNEGLQRPADKNSIGNPDFYKAAIRGVYEELGITLSEDLPLFLSFGLDWELYQYGLLGRVRLNLTYKEVNECRELNSKDKWEGKLYAIPFTLKHFADFVRHNASWSPAGLVCVIHSLMADEGLTIESIMKELAKAGVNYKISS